MKKRYILMLLGGLAFQKAQAQANTNLFLGYESGRYTTTGISNTFLGYQTGWHNLTGSQNLFIGNLAGYNNNIGIYNMFLGNLTGFYNTSGNYNAFIGSGAGHHNTTGSNNTYIGQNAGIEGTTAQDNVSIGREAGSHNLSGTFNTFIGSLAGVTTAYNNLTNATAIGANAQVTASNSVILGNAANVGIGTSAPQNKLEITKGSANQSGLRLTNLTSNSPASATNQTKFLSVNANGDVILASLNASTRLAANESLWQTQGDFIQNTNPQGVIIGSQINRTPAGYKLFVEDGILTEKVKVALRSTQEWSDKVFDATYRLPSLGEVSAYIARHHHLPDVPSAEEVVNKGLDLGQMDARLLQKIEELTLYLLEQDKRFNQQEQRLNALQLENERIKKELAQLKTNR